MSEHAVLSADFATYKPVPTRKVLQLVLEVPLERQSEVFEKLGWPMPGESLPVAVARLNETAAAPVLPDAAAGDSRSPTSKPDGADARPPTSKRWHELTRAQQAGIRCGEERFFDFLWHTKNVDINSDPAEAVRQICDVRTRADLNVNHSAASCWDQLDAEYRAWAGLDTEQRG